MDFGPILRAMSRNKVRFTLIAVEIALTLAIVTNCVTLIRDSRVEMSKSSGFDEENLIWVRSTPFDRSLKEEGALDALLRQDLAALSTMPGVVAATNTRFRPWQGGGSSTEVRVAGTKGASLRTQVYNMDEKTVDALGIRIVEGKGFTRDELEAETKRLNDLFASDREKGTDGKPKEKFMQPVVISQAFGRLAFQDKPLLGQLLEDSDGDLYKVVGVVDTFYNPYGWPIHEYAMFYPSFSRSFEGGAPFLVRSEPGRRDAVAGALEKRLLEVNPGRNLKVGTILELKGRRNGSAALLVRILGIIIGLLVFVTSLGIVGLTSFSVTERTRQIGTRRALGAQKEDILRYFLLENWLVTSFGIVLGVFFSYGLNVLLVTHANAKKLDLTLVLLGVVLLWAAGLASALFPALRGSRVAPAIATRNV